MNLLWKCLALTMYLGMITIIDPLFFHLLKKYRKIYTLSYPPPPPPPPDVVDFPQSPILTQDTISEGNLGNITSTVVIDISIKEGVVENINLGVNCSPEEVVSYTALFKEFAMSSLGATKKCQGSILRSLCMRLKLTQV
jgi:hypothetical protein